MSPIALPNIEWSSKKKKKKTLKDIINAILISSWTLLNLWRETILSNYHIQNRISYRKTGKTTYELRKVNAPNKDTIS